MMNKSITDIFYGLHKTIRKHSPELLTGIGIGGMITTIGLAIKATPRAMQHIDDCKQINGDNAKKIDILKYIWKDYLPMTISGIASISCILGASAVNNKRNAALATAYSISESALQIYKDKVIETIGEKEEQKVRDAIAKDKIDKNPVVTREIIVTEKGNTLCYETLSGRYFKSDMETIKKAVNEINRRMIGEMYISLNDFYDEIGLTNTKIGDEIGWNVNRKMLELTYSSQLASDGTPCLVIDYIELPRYDYDK